MDPGMQTESKFSVTGHGGVVIIRHADRVVALPPSAILKVETGESSDDKGIGEPTVWLRQEKKDDRLRFGNAEEAAEAACAIAREWARCHSWETSGRVVD